MTPLEFLQAVYEDDRLPLTTRMRAAAEAAPYMHPKLAVIANLENRGFGDQLEERVSRRLRLIPKNGGV